MDKLFCSKVEKHVFAYLDDIILVTETFEQHMVWLERVIRTLIDAKLVVNRDKCEFCCQSVKFLGYVLDSSGLRVDSDRVRPIYEYPAPKNVKQVRRLLGMVGWYSRFIKNEAEIKVPLSKLLRKDVTFVWGPEQEKAFEALKRCLSEAPVLVRPDFSKEFAIQTDASDYAVGAVLTQEYEDGEHPVYYVSRVLSRAEQRYTTTEKECLAVIWAIEKFRPYVEGSRFKVVTDHRALTWLRNFKDPQGRESLAKMDGNSGNNNREQRRSYAAVVAGGGGERTPSVSLTASGGDEVAPSSVQAYASEEARASRDAEAELESYLSREELGASALSRREPEGMLVVEVSGESLPISSGVPVEEGEISEDWGASADPVDFHYHRPAWQRTDAEKRRARKERRRRNGPCQRSARHRQEKDVARIQTATSSRRRSGARCWRPCSRTRSCNNNSSRTGSRSSINSSCVSLNIAGSRASFNNSNCNNICSWLDLHNCNNISNRSWSHNNNNISKSPWWWTGATEWIGS
ncbi:unnamed protein product [Trichogramma brassicae]|uniref:RNA-directed DNA polymerase n=1 Tax=Trichogramma brassicae TaxID=86971 RepID=A0A6H5I7K9_9HYME|nr:unnamed protein product [Trichogramma brassicae]